MKEATKNALMLAHQRTRGHLLGEANHEMWAKEVVLNLPAASLQDLQANAYSLVHYIWVVSVPACRFIVQNAGPVV